MERAAALGVLERYAPELSEPARGALLDEQSVTRRVGGQDQVLLDPYAAAVAHLMNPATVKARTEGSVSETYIDPEKVAAYLQGESLRLRECWPAADVSSTTTDFDYTITVLGW
ncbi:hypothetical protein [Deinococcus aquatilis]|uniref:hypothetical protein n=1 Tax=Deinococcus aquatilis TaxID=519440 RepID=UPI000379DF73|nr:hypothetical protein [Deinococcus aquatilis]